MKVKRNGRPVKIMESGGIFSSMGKEKISRLTFVVSFTFLTSLRALYLYSSAVLNLPFTTFCVFSSFSSPRGMGAIKGMEKV